MAEKITVWGVKLDKSCGEHLDIVKTYAGSSSSHKREQANRSLDILIERGCTDALRKIVDKYSGSSSSHKRELAEKALEGI